MTKKKRTWIFTLLALLIIALHIAPFYIMINMSLKTLSDRSSRWMPALHPHFENYVTAMEHGNLMSAMWNTFQITALSVIIIVVAGAMAAYPLARKASRKNQIILTFIVGVMMVPQLSILVPLYKEMVTLKGINKLWGIVIVSATFHLPMAIYMYSNFIRSIPKELDEAAMIDGASLFQTLLRVIIPVAKPALSTCAITSFLFIYNELPIANVLITKPQLKPISVALLNLKGDFGTLYAVSFASIVISIIPTVIFYLIAQEKVESSICSGVVKG